MSVSRKTQTQELPDYLGFGVLDRESVKRAQGKTVCRYCSGADLVYEITLSQDECQLVECYDGQEIGRRVEASLTDAFFLHWAKNDIAQNPRLAAMARYIQRELRLHLIFSPEYIFFPAGFIFTIRFPIDAAYRSNWTRLRQQLAGQRRPFLLDQEYPAAVLRMTSTGQVHSEKLLAVDGGALMIDLSDALEWLQANLIPQVAEVYRPVVMNGMERDRIHLHPTHESAGIVAYSVLPLHQTVVSLEQGMEEFRKAAQPNLGN